MIKFDCNLVTPSGEIMNNPSLSTRPEGPSSGGSNLTFVSILQQYVLQTFSTFLTLNLLRSQPVSTNSSKSKINQNKHSKTLCFRIMQLQTENKCEGRRLRGRTVLQDNKHRFWS